MTKVPIPIYKGNLYIHIGRPSSTLSNKYNLEIDADHHAAVHEVGEDVFVWFSRDVFEPSIVAHEAIHIKNIVFGQISAKPDFENDEHEAYFVEWVVETIEKVFKKYNHLK